jgi:peptidyl-prolyl cis-trans isomerase D
MLQSIRDRTHGWIAGVIIALVILSFALWGIHSYLEASATTEVVAKVNGVEIYKRQLAATLDPLRNQAQMSLGSSVLPESVEASLKKRALDALVNIQALRQSSISQNYRITDTQVDSYLVRMPDFQVNGEFSLTRLRQILANNMLSIADFLELIKTTLLIDQPRLGILLTEFVLPNEVNNTVALVNQERDLAYLVVPQDTYMQQPAEITEAQMQAYYKLHQEDFKTPEQVTLDYLELSTKDLAADIHPTDDMLKNYYNDNINSYTIPAQWNLAEILVPVSEMTTEDQINAAEKKVTDMQEDIKKGADFAALMKQYPSADNKPDTWLALSQLPPELQKPVSALTKVGDVSDPVKVAKGLMIIKVVGLKEAQVQPFDQVKDKVQESLVRQLAEEKYADLREKLANVTYEHPDSLEPAAKALGLTIKTSQPFTREKGASDISSNRKIRDAAFTDDVLNSSNNSDAIQAGADSTIVLRVKSHVPAALLSLQAVQKQVTDQLKVLNAEKEAEALAHEIKKKLQHGDSPDQIASEYHLTWNKSGFIGRYSNKVDSAVLYTAFRLPKPQPGTIGLFDTVKMPTGYAVVMVSTVRDADKKDNQEENDVFADQIQNTLGLLDYKLYVQSVMADSKVSVYTDVQQG